MNEKLIQQIKEKKKYISELGFKYNESPKLCVIVTSFNQKNNIKNLVKGLRQTQGVDEIIVCEDGSIDGSLQEWDTWMERPNDIILRLNDLHEIRSTDRAIRMTKADIICIVQDDDEIYHSSWANEVIEMFDKDDKLGIVGGMFGYHDFFNVNKMICRWSGRKQLRPNAKASNKFSYVENVNVGPYFVRRKYYDELGGWDFNLSKPGEMGMGFDHELCYRMWLNGYKVGHYFPYNFLNDEKKGSTYSLGGTDARSKKMKFMENYIEEKFKNNINEVKKYVKEANE